MKSKEQYLFEYESILKQTGTTQQKLNELNTRKQQLQYQSNSADQILSINQQVGTLSIQLEQLNKQSAIYKNELSALTYNDSNLKQRISNLESQYQTTLEAINTYDQAFTDIMVILNGFSAKEGLELNQAQVLIKILSPEELIHTDVLKKACEMNHKEEFDKAIAKITDINFQDKDGKTILMHAISNGFYYGVDKLLARGADVNLLDNKGANALIYCAELPHIKYIKIIAEMTADLNHKAAGYGNVDALHLLIPNGNKVLFASELNGELNGTSDKSSLLITDENYTIKNGWTGDIIIGNCTLTIESDVSLGVTSNNSSSYEKTLRITEFLISRGMNINSQNDQGLTPFFLACDQGLSHLAHELLKQYGDKIDFSLKDIPDNTYLHYASRLPDSTDIVELILNKIDVNAKNTGGGTAALQAAMRNNVEILSLLIKNNADISILDVEGRHLWHYASQYNAIDSMKFLKDKISSIIDLRTINPMSATALHTASELGHLTLAKWLLEEQADINAQTGQLGLTPFFLACRKKNFDMAEYLFNHPRFNNGIIDTSGFGSLHWALELKDIAILQKILNKGIDIDLRDNEGKTTLFWTTHYNWSEGTEFLMNHAANPNIPDTSGSYPLHIATSLGLIDMVNLLVKHCNINARTTNEHKITALYLAAQDGKLEIVKILTGLGADLNIIRETNGMPPLHVAMQKKQTLVAEELLTRGANVNIVDGGGQIALHWAATLTEVGITQTILAKGTNIDAQNNGGATPLYIAVHNNNNPITTLLISNGANHNIPDNGGTFPWHLASFSGFLEIMKTLSSKVPNIDYKTANNDQYTALWLASQQGHLETVDWLISKQADVNAARGSDGRTALQAAICSKNLPMVQELVDHNANVNKGDHKQFTPLYHAVELEDLKIIKLLIDHGANVTAAGNSGDQPIHMAAFLSNILIMKILFDHGASINATSNIGNTLLHEVLWEGSKADPVDKLNAVKYLLTKSANPQTVNNEGKTAIDLAKTDFQEALPWLEHPENLLPLHQFESDLIGNFSYSEL